MNMENELRKALRRESPPAGFADRVIAKAGQPVRLPSRQPWWKFRPLVFANAFLLTAVLSIGGLMYKRHEEQRALEARRQLVTALNVTRASLQKAQERIRRVAAKPIL
jgi:hypothetical protein